LSYTFPLGIPSLWAAPTQFEITDQYLKNWLLDKGSLTERLQSHSSDFRLQLLGQRPGQISLEESQQLGLLTKDCHQQQWQIREVLLWGDNQPWVFARSIIPQALCDKDFLDLNDKPLGQLIFNDRRFKRLPFQVTHMSDSLNFLAQLNIEERQDIGGRRSTFGFKDLTMLISEVFLPQAPAYSGQSETNE
jgi:chorismate--pyruvate lyase